MEPGADERVPEGLLTTMGAGFGGAGAAWRVTPAPSKADQTAGVSPQRIGEERHRVLVGHRRGGLDARDALVLEVRVERARRELEQVHHEDGSVSMDLKGRFQNVAVARINQDGTVTESCVDNPQAAGAFFGIDPKLIEEQAHKPVDSQPGPQTVERKQ